MRGGPGYRLSGWRFAAGFGGFVAAIGLTIYPIIFAPMMNPEPWKQISEDIRREAGIKQENIQVWIRIASVKVFEISNNNFSARRNESVDGSFWQARKAWEQVRDYITQTQVKQSD